MRGAGERVQLRNLEERLRHGSRAPVALAIKESDQEKEPTQ